jgi:hypothetical protein
VHEHMHASWWVGEMPTDNPDDGESTFKSSPTGPVVTAQRLSNRPQRSQTNLPPRKVFWRHPILSAILFLLIVGGVGIRAYRDLSRPEAWAYWRDRYHSPTLSAVVISKAVLDDFSQTHRAIAIRGRIGPAAASWFRKRLDEAHLGPGDLVLMSSPGGDVGQALIMGEIIRARGLATAVGAADTPGRIHSAYCASACVLVYAGGKPRYGIEGSLLGVHRFVTKSPVNDPVADAQRTTGILLGYMTRMGVASSVVEAMSATSDIRWLDPKEALSMNLITEPTRTKTRSSG